MIIAMTAPVLYNKLLFFEKNYQTEERKKKNNNKNNKKRSKHNMSPIIKKVSYIQKLASFVLT
jgi:hypothetical protein